LIHLPSPLIKVKMPSQGLLIQPVVILRQFDFFNRSGRAITLLPFATIPQGKT